MVRQKYYIYCALWLLLAALATAAQYRFDQWTTDNGLPQNTVRHIVQTSDGYLWFTTLDGLVRFDGVRFTVFNKSNSKNLLSNRFIYILKETDDTLWVSSEEQGVVRYRNGEFRTFTTADGLPSDSVFEMKIKPDGHLYARTTKGLARFDGTRFTSTASYKESLQSETILGSSGTYWELDANHLSALRNGQKSVFDLPPQIKNEFIPGYDFILATQLFEDRDGVLWISTNSYALFLNGRLFKFANGKFEEVLADGMPPALTYDIAQDRGGNIWLGTRGSGACRLSQNKFTCFNTKNDLSTDQINKIFTDREGTVWISTEDKGIYRLTEQFITSLSTEQGLDKKNVYPIFEDPDGAIWVGSFGGLARYKDGKFTNYKESDGLTNNQILSILKDRDGRLWLGTYNGVPYFENGKFYDFTETLFPNMPAPAVTDIHQDRRGILWFASNAGLARYDGQSVKLFSTDDGLPENNVKVLLENPDGSLWLGTYNGIALLKDEQFTVYSEKDGLAGNHVRSLYKDETGTLWIGTYESGLSRFKDGRFTNFTVENGLSSNGVFQILEDARRNFWISSNQGIYRVSRDELNEFADGRRPAVTSTLYGKSDGMLTAEANGGGQPAGIKTPDGRLWFPTQDGVAVVDPEAVKINPLPPPVVIESGRIDNQKIAGLRNGIEMLPGQENLEIDYTGLSFIRPEQLRFRYRLEGFDEKWTEAGNRRTAFYPHLAPGEYVFHVIAANSDDVWNETGARVSIIVRPPFYRTSWFIAIAVLMSAIIVFALFRRRVAQLEKARAAQQAFSRQLIASQEKERKRIAAELHDSLGQRLVVIKNLALMFLNAKNGAAAEGEERIEAISAEASEAIGEVKEISYNLRPYQLDRIGLTKAVEAIVRSAQTASGIEFSSKIDDIDDYFPKDAEINFYRIVQECVNNLVKHSEATEAFIGINRASEILELEIGDNGKGFTPSQTESKTGGFGMIGIVERAELFGGRVDIKSAPDQGTNIKIRLNSRNFLRDS